jgi:hypothetical protein
MDKKYTPHIRIPFSLFDSPEYKQIPDTIRPYCLVVLVCLLKFVNNKSGKCYPRRSTISSMTGLSNSTIYKATEELKKVKIIHTKRLPSTLLYIIEDRFISGDMRNKKVSGVINTSDMRNRDTLKELSYYNISYITTIVREVLSNKSATKDDIINKLATLPTARLEQAIKEKDNILYCKEALEVQSKKGQKLVDLPSNMILENIRKKTNFAYQRAIEKRKRDDVRQSRSKDLLRSDFKAKR